MDDTDFLFPEPNAALVEAATRHAAAWAYAMEAIDLAHIAYERERDTSAQFVPGIPTKRRVRNDINDDAWRFFRAIGEPLVEANLIAGFENIDGGDVLVLPDGLHARMKKGNGSGATSNYPTPRVCSMGARADSLCLFSAATPLDVAIQDGVWFDAVYVVGEAMGEYRHVGLRFAMAEYSPFLMLDPPTQDQLMAISPSAYELVVEARTRLAR